MTFLRKDGSVKICSMILRMGIGDSKVDNASSGGITVGIQESGNLKRKAYSVDGMCYDLHPTTGIEFDKIKIPNISLIKDLVLNQAPNFPHFRLISWDIALDKDNCPILIEANLCDGELDFHQLNNGYLCLVMKQRRFCQRCFRDDGNIMSNLVSQMPYLQFQG